MIKKPVKAIKREGKILKGAVKMIKDARQDRQAKTKKNGQNCYLELSARLGIQCWEIGTHQKSQRELKQRK
jgi:hypothetical protein